MLKTYHAYLNKVGWPSSVVNFLIFNYLFKPESFKIFIKEQMSSIYEPWYLFFLSFGIEFDNFYILQIDLHLPFIIEYLAYFN